MFRAKLHSSEKTPQSELAKTSVIDYRYTIEYRFSANIRKSFFIDQRSNTLTISLNHRQSQSNYDKLTTKLDGFVETRLWPPEQKLSFRGWLSNFKGREKQTGAKILNCFTYINDTFALKALKKGFKKVITDYTVKKCQDQLFCQKEDLNDIVDRLFITAIRGEDENLTDSGIEYAKNIGRDFYIEDERILKLDQLLAKNTKNTLIVLVDDFLSTGNQLTNTMLRSPQDFSLAAKLDQNEVVASVTTLFTNRAKMRIASRFPKLKIYGGHEIKVEDYTISKLLPPSRHKDVYRLLEKYAQVLRVSNGIDPIFGMNEYGLLLGIGNSIPDSTIPLLWAKGPEYWRPLKR